MGKNKGGEKSSLKSAREIGGKVENNKEPKLAEVIKLSLKKRNNLLLFLLEIRKRQHR